MLLNIRFTDGSEKNIYDLSFLSFNGNIFTYELQKSDPWGKKVGSFSSDPALPQIDSITVLAKSATLWATTEAYEIRRSVTNVIFDATGKKFLGNLSYAGLVNSFKVEEIGF